MNDDPAYTVGNARIGDLAAMLELEKTYFASCWHSEPSGVKKLMEKEPMMFRVCKTYNEVKGYYWVFPLTCDIWKLVVTGQMTEDAMVKHIRDFSQPNLYLYLATVIVDQEDKWRKKYTKALVYDFGRNFVLGRNRKADVKGVGAFTISEGGKRLMERSNFIYKGSFKADGKLARSYMASHQNLLAQAHLIQKKDKVKNIA